MPRAGLCTPEFNLGMDSSDVAPVPCSRCRTRRVKCDRRPGGCLRCEKVAEECPGYSRVRRFHDEGPSLRKKLSKAQDRHRRKEEPARPLSPLTSSPAQESPAGPSTFNTPPSLGQDALDVGVASASGAASSETHAEDCFFDDAYFDLDPDVYYAQEDNLCGFAPGILLAEDVWDQQASVFHATDTPQTSAGAFSETTGAQEAESCPELQLHEALLTRHFVEVISPWLDVFDADRYFGHTVPVNSLRSMLLRDTILAIAARQIGNRRRDAAFAGDGDEMASFAELETREHGMLVDWSYEAAGFYDRAIRGMVTSLQYIDFATGHHEGYPAGGDMEDSDDVDDILSAVSMFLLYESLDDRHPGIAQHMVGAQHLLQLVLRQRHPLPPVGTDTYLPPAVGITQAWRASFWNLASFDYINSYARQSKTRLDFADAHLWEASGLPMTRVGGHHIPNALLHGGPGRMTEVMACRSLIWVVLKTLHYVFSRDQDHHDDPPSANSEPVHWHQLEQHLKDWYSVLPTAFEACIRMPPKPGHPTHASTVNVPFPQLFYTSTMGATALLLYHFTRILVLLNKPPEDTGRQTGLGRLRSHRQLAQQVEHHAEEICGIAVGRPQHGAQLHLVQPLCLAGFCLEKEARRVVLADLLVGVQRRTGYSTEWRLVKLREEWGCVGGS